MLTDLATTVASHLHGDVCVVGAGPVGISVALRAAEAGLHVVLLDAGGPEQESAVQKDAVGESIGLPYYPIEEARVRAFGGTSTHWYAHGWFRARPLDPIDFEGRTPVNGPGWPITGEDLAPALRTAHELSGLGAYDYDTATYVTPERPELPWIGDRFRTVMFKLTPPGAWVRRWDEVRSAENIHLVLHANVVGMELDGPERVRRLQVRTPSGGEVSVSARAHVLAAGGLDNARLLLAARSDAHPTGIGNRHDHVGRWFMEHPHARTAAIAPSDPTLLERVGLYDRHDAGEGGLEPAPVEVQGKLSLREDVLRDEGLLNATFFVRRRSRHRASPAITALNSLRRQSFRPRPDRVAGHVANVARGFPSIAGTAAEVVASKARGVPPREELLELEVMLEQAPNRNSRVGLGKGTDRFGRPRLELDWQVTDLDRRTLDRTMALLDHELREHGHGRLAWRFGDIAPPEVLKPGWHHIGTTRMSAEAADGVVDVDCRVHAMQDLYVVGSSVFPTAGFANPTLTAVAFGVRLGDHLGRRLA